MSIGSTTKVCSHCVYIAAHPGEGVLPTPPKLEHKGKQSKGLKTVSAQLLLPLPKNSSSSSSTATMMRDCVPETMLTDSQKASRVVEGAGDHLLASLNSVERGCFEATVQENPLGDRICGFEALAVDLYKSLNDLQTLIPIDKRMNFLKQFSSTFLIGYLTFSSEKDLRSLLNPKFLASVLFRFFLTKDELVKSFENTRKELRKYVPASSGESLKRLVAQVEAHFNLLIKCCSSSEAQKLLTDMRLRSFSCVLPFSQRKADPQKALTDLLGYSKLVLLGFSGGRELGKLHIETAGTFFSPFFHQALVNFSQKQNQLELACKVQEVLCNTLRTTRTEVEKWDRLYELGKSNQLSYSEYCLVTGATLSGPELLVPLGVRVLSSYRQVGLSIAFGEDFLRTFEESILMPLHPGAFSHLQTLKMVQMNLGALLQAEEMSADMYSSMSKQISSCQGTVFSEQETNKVREIITEISTDMEKLFHDKVLSQPYWKEIQKLHKAGGLAMDDYNSSIRVLEALKPSLPLVKDLGKEIEILHNKHLEKIQEFLETMESISLYEWEQLLINMFGHILFSIGVKCSHFVLIAKSVELLLRKDLISIRDEDDMLLPTSLINYMSSEHAIALRIDKIIEERLEADRVYDQEGRDPIEAPLRQPVPLQEAPSSSSSSSSPAQGSPKKSSPLKKSPAPPFQEKAPEYPVFEKDKMRVIMSKLAELGFEPVSTRGSHWKLEDGKGGGSVIVPKANQGDYELPRGTLQSIQEQVHAAIGRRSSKTSSSLLE